MTTKKAKKEKVTDAEQLAAKAEYERLLVEYNELVRPDSTKGNEAAANAAAIVKEYDDACKTEYRPTYKGVSDEDLERGVYKVPVRYFTTNQTLDSFNA